MRPTDVRRQHERPAHARRREDPFVAESVDRRVTGGAVRVARAPHAVLGEAMGAERRRHGGEWLRGRRLLAGNVARGDGTLLHRENRLTGLAVEDEQHAGLRGLDDGGRRGAAVRDRHERRRRSIVVIPQIVVNRLKRPDHSAGRGPQGHDRVGVAVPPEAEHAVVVGGSASGGDEHEAALGGRGQHRPRVGGACLMGHRTGPSGPGESGPRST